MTASREAAGEGRVRSACRECLRRAWLLQRLGPLLDYAAGNPDRLGELLALPDEDLVDALGGRRAAEIRVQMSEARLELPPPASGIGALCRHDPSYPRSLLGIGSPRLLYFTGGLPRLRRLTQAPLVTIIGSSRSSAYGLEVARSLGRGLAACGVGIAASLADEISAAAHQGAIAAGRGSIALAGSGLGVPPVARRRPLGTLLQRHGCLLSELPPGCGGRRWGPAAVGRTAQELGQVMVLIEAEPGSRSTAAGERALAQGRMVAAVPGRVTSPLSAGPHSLIRRGAVLVGGTSELLDLLHGLAGGPGTEARRSGAGPAADSGVVPADLEPWLRVVLEQLALGDGSPEELGGGGHSPEEVMFALSELELRGLVVRAEGGKYLPRLGPG